MKYIPQSRNNGALEDNDDHPRAMRPAAASTVSGGVKFGGVGGRGSEYREMGVELRPTARAGELQASLLLHDSETVSVSEEGVTATVTAQPLDYVGLVQHVQHLTRQMQSVNREVESVNRRVGSVEGALPRSRT